MSGNEEIAKTHSPFSQWKLSLHEDVVHPVLAAKIIAFSLYSMSLKVGSKEC